MLGELGPKKSGPAIITYKAATTQALSEIMGSDRD